MKRVGWAIVDVLIGGAFIAGLLILTWVVGSLIFPYVMDDDEPRTVMTELLAGAVFGIGLIGMVMVAGMIGWSVRKGGNRDSK